MEKIHVILPQGCDPNCNGVLRSALDDFASAAFPHAEVAVHQGDSAYERAKNPLWGREADVYVPSPVGTERTAASVAAYGAELPHSLPPDQSGWKS